MRALIGGRRLVVTGVQQDWVVSAVQLRDVRVQFPVSLVCRQFLIRALLDDTVSAEAPGAVSTTSCTSGRTQHVWSRSAAL